jgi:hypothetical protein
LINSYASLILKDRQVPTANYQSFTASNAC